MNLQPVRAHLIDLKFPQQATCRACREKFRLHTGYADLDGQPWAAFYCQPCGEVIRVRQRLEAERKAKEAQ